MEKTCSTDALMSINNRSRTGLKWCSLIPAIKPSNFGSISNPMVTQKITSIRVEPNICETGSRPSPEKTISPLC